MIKAPKAGPELDARVAREVMNWEIAGPWSPSTDIAAAWEVVEKIGLFSDEAYDGIGFTLWHDANGWFVGTPDFRTGVQAPTAPLAICLAALEALKEKR